MFLFAVAAAVLAVTVATAVVLSWRHRRNVLARVRSTWGMPRHRVRNMDAIADYHRSLAAAPSASPALDDRTVEVLGFVFRPPDGPIGTAEGVDDRL